MKTLATRPNIERTLRNAGIQVLHNQRVNVDGLDVIGVSYRDAAYPMHLRTFLDGLALNGTASILLNHVPNRLPIVEQAGVSLQLSGHTHGGQIVPFTWLTRRAFGKYTYGLQQFGRLQVLTSSGAGTWGPPMRVGSAAEVVLITFAGERQSESVQLAASTPSKQGSPLMGANRARDGDPVRHVV